MSAQYYRDNLLRRHIVSLFRHHEDLRTFQHDIARVHTARVSADFLTETTWQCLIDQLSLLICHQSSICGTILDSSLPRSSTAKSSPTRNSIGMRLEKDHTSSHSEVYLHVATLRGVFVFSLQSCYNFKFQLHYAPPEIPFKSVVHLIASQNSVSKFNENWSMVYRTKIE